MTCIFIICISFFLSDSDLIFLTDIILMQLANTVLPLLQLFKVFIRDQLLARSPSLFTRQPQLQHVISVSGFIVRLMTHRFLLPLTYCYLLRIQFLDSSIINVYGMNAEFIGRTFSSPLSFQPYRGTLTNNYFFKSISIILLAYDFESFTLLSSGAGLLAVPEASTVHNLSHLAPGISCLYLPETVTPRFLFKKC